MRSSTRVAASESLYDHLARLHERVLSMLGKDGQHAAQERILRGAEVVENAGETVGARRRARRCRCPCPSHPAPPVGAARGGPSTGRAIAVEPDAVASVGHALKVIPAPEL